MKKRNIVKFLMLSSVLSIVCLNTEINCKTKAMDTNELTAIDIIGDRIYKDNNDRGIEPLLGNIGEEMLDIVSHLDVLKNTKLPEINEKLENKYKEEYNKNLVYEFEVAQQKIYIDYSDMLKRAVKNNAECCFSRLSSFSGYIDGIYSLFNKYKNKFAGWKELIKENLKLSKELIEENKRFIEREKSKISSNKEVDSCNLLIKNINSQISSINKLDGEIELSIFEYIEDNKLKERNAVYDNLKEEVINPQIDKNEYIKGQKEYHEAYGKKGEDFEKKLQEICKNYTEKLETAIKKGTLNWKRRMNFLLYCISSIYVLLKSNEDNSNMFFYRYYTNEERIGFYLSAYYGKLLNKYLKNNDVFIKIEEPTMGKKEITEYNNVVGSINGYLSCINDMYPKEIVLSGKMVKFSGDKLKSLKKLSKRS